MLFKDDPWIIFTRNIIAWITKNKANSPSQPLKVLIISSTVRTDFSSILRKVRFYVSVNYLLSLKDVNVAKYDCILIENLKFFEDSDISKVTEFV
jgi:hypothetical protein